jgi:hypothetical protein
LVFSYYSILEAYTRLGTRYSRIAITGGEPTTLPERLRTIAKLARKYFGFVSLWTQEPKVATWPWLEEFFDDVVLGVHDPIEVSVFKYDYNTLKIPVYISILTHLYNNSMPRYFKFLEYSGMTVREQYPRGSPLKSLLPTYANFPIRYVKAADCYGGFALLPNNNYVELI